MDTDDYGLCHPETGKRDGPNNTRVNCSLIDGYPYADSGSGFTWTSAKENFGVPFAPDLDMQVDGMLGSYDGSGFVRDIKPAPDQYAVAPETFDDAIAELKDYLWFDQRTRAAMISFAVYNGNYDMFMSVQFLFEITQAGLVLPQYAAQSRRAIHGAIRNLAHSRRKLRRRPRTTPTPYPVPALPGTSSSRSRSTTRGGSSPRPRCRRSSTRTRRRRG